MRQLLYSPQFLLCLSFLVLICLGTIFLLLPAASVTQTSVVDAVFTAVSAVCVTGLTVVDTGTHFTRFGQIVILILIQLGGLGVMTVGATLFILLGQRLSFGTERALYESLYQGPKRFRLIHDVKRIALITGLIEGVGATVLFFLFRNRDDVGGVIFSSIFHAISAFCNAGFSLYQDSLVRFNQNPYILATFAALIVVGGIGYPVLLELARSFRGMRNNTMRWHRLSLHTRVVIVATVALLTFGALGIFLGENHQQSLGETTTVSSALFQSVTARTAGFNTVEISSYSLMSLLILILLMFIGGSPASCAGGVKTTSVIVWFAFVRAVARAERDVRFMKRRIPWPIVNKALVLLLAAITFNVCGIWILAMTELLSNPELGFHDIVFEQVSSFATVGLSTGVTSHLSGPGKVWIMFSMFVGRLGPLTVGLLLLREKPRKIRYPGENILVG